MTSFVVDASALVDYLFRTARGTAIENTIRMPDAEFHVPALCDVEIAAALRRALLARRASVDHVGRVLDAYSDLPLTRHGHLRLLPRMLALRNNFSPYDATYVALAEALDATLVTTDAALARAARRHVTVAR